MTPQHLVYFEVLGCLVGKAIADSRMVRRSTAALLAHRRCSSTWLSIAASTTGCAAKKACWGSSTSRFARCSARWRSAPQLLDPVLGASLRKLAHLLVQRNAILSDPSLV